MWSYEQKLSYLNNNSEQFIGSLGVNIKPRILEGRNLGYHVLSVAYYNGEEDDYLAGRFSNDDINEMLSANRLANLDALHESDLEVNILRATNDLWGFNFDKNSKLWIPEYKPRVFSFN